MVRVKMLCNYASPKTILHAGKSYKVEDELAEQLLADGSGPDGKGAAVLADEDAKLTKVPVAPDPGETKPDVDD